MPGKKKATAGELSELLDTYAEKMMTPNPKQDKKDIPPKPWECSTSGGKRKPTAEELHVWVNAWQRKREAKDFKRYKKDLYLELLECYNTMPIYITDPAIFQDQCATAMSQASDAEQFVEIMAFVKERNMSEVVTYVQERLAKKGGRCPGLSCLVSMDSMLDLAGVPVHEGLLESDSTPITELNYKWLRYVSNLLPDKSEYVGGLPPDYLSSDESGSEEDSQSEYAESGGDEEPVKSKKSQKRGASRPTTDNPSTSASTEGRTLRNGKRTRTSDDADTVVDEAPKNKRRRKGETTSKNKISNKSSSTSSRSSNKGRNMNSNRSNSSSNNKSRNRNSNRSNSNSSSASPRTESAPAAVGETDLLEVTYPVLRRSGRLNRVTGRRSLP